MSDDVEQGPSADFCTKWPYEGHDLRSTKPAGTRMWVRSCGGCGWVDGADLAEQEAAAVERGRQQGWREAIAALRDDERGIAWFRARVDDDATAPPWPPGQYPPRREYAEYLASVAPTEGTQTSGEVTG